MTLSGYWVLSGNWCFYLTGDSEVKVHKLNLKNYSALNKTFMFINKMVMFVSLNVVQLKNEIIPPMQWSFGRVINSQRGGEHFKSLNVMALKLSRLNDNFVNLGYEQRHATFTSNNLFGLYLL